MMPRRALITTQAPCLNAVAVDQTQRSHVVIFRELIVVAKHAVPERHLCRLPITHVPIIAEVEDVSWTLVLRVDEHVVGAAERTVRSSVPYLLFVVVCPAYLPGPSEIRISTAGPAVHPIDINRVDVPHVQGVRRERLRDGTATAPPI